MHLSDTLVFGPLHPLLPQPVRVRLVALLVGLVCLVGGLGILTFAGLVLVLGPTALPASARALVPGWASPAEPKATTQQMLVSSNPAGSNAAWPADPDGHCLRIFRVPYRVFLPAMSLGGLIYIIGYTMLGYFAGPVVLGLFEALHLPLGLLGSGGPLLGPLAVLILVRRGLPHPLPRPALGAWPGWPTVMIVIIAAEWRPGLVRSMHGLEQLA